MIHIRLALLLGIVILAVALPIYATPAPVPLFNECPQVGQALGCSYLVEFGSKGSVNLLSEKSVKDVDGQGDILVGFLNNSGSYISLAGYTGPNNIFSGTQLKGGLGDGKSTYFEWTDPFGDGKEKKDCGDTDWGGKSCGDGGSGSHVTPEPGSIMLLGTGLVVLGGVLRRKLLP